MAKRRLVRGAGRGRGRSGLSAGRPRILHGVSATQGAAVLGINAVADGLRDRGPGGGRQPVAGGTTRGPDCRIRRPTLADGTSAMTQRGIPCMFMRGGTSRGPFFFA